MAVNAEELDIVYYPAAVLRAKAKPIDKVTAEVKAVAARMIEIMHRMEGVGLAGPQVGLPWRIFVADVPEDEEEGRSASPTPSETPGEEPDPPSATLEPRVYINPTLTAYSREKEPFNEGCLSLPKIRGEVIRPRIVTINAIGLNGKPFTERASGLLARCWQHECDHLDGVLILDRMTQMSRLKNRVLVRDLERDE